MKKYCDSFKADAAFGGEPPVYGFRVDSENLSCLINLGAGNSMNDNYYVFLINQKFMV